jgi:uncharacterized protein YoxC
VPTAPADVVKFRNVRGGSATVRRKCVAVKNLSKSGKHMPPPDCPYDPTTCAMRFDALEKALEGVEGQLLGLKERVDKLPNGEKLDLILDFVQANSSKLTNVGPKIEAMSQRVDRAMKVADIAEKKAEQNKDSIHQMKEFRDVMLKEVIDRLQRIEGKLK